MIKIKQYKNRFFINSPYDRDLHAIIRCFKGRYWDEETKTWKISNEFFDEFIEKLKASGLEYELEQFRQIATVTEKGDLIELQLNKMMLPLNQQHLINYLNLEIES